MDAACDPLTKTAATSSSPLCHTCLQVPHQSGGAIELHANYLTVPLPGSPLVYPVREVSPVHLEAHSAHNALVVLTEGGHSFVRVVR